MELLQSFETTIETTHPQPTVDGFRFLFAPNRDGMGDLPFAHQAAQFLGLEYLADISSAAALPAIISALLQGDEAAVVAEAMHSPWPNPEVRAETALLAENLAFARVVPIRTNPLDLQSLATVLTTGSGVAAGAWAGVVASGGTPLILVTLPAGMIIGGAAAGIGSALESGLRERVSAWIRPRTKTERRHVHSRIIRLRGDEAQNADFLVQLKAIPGVEKQTRFILEEEPGVVRIGLWSADPINDEELQDLAARTGAEIMEVTDDTSE